MKSFNKIFTLLLSGAMLAGCNDLDIEPMGSTITEDQKQDVINIDPGKALASVTGISSQMGAFGSISGGAGSDDQSDIGIPGLFLQMDLRGQDMFSVNMGYNWFINSQQMSDGTPTGNAIVIWLYCYNIIRSANEVIATNMPHIDLDNPDDNTEQLKLYVAQAAAFRAFAYTYLAQSFQFTYDGHQNDPCVPIVTEENMKEAVNGVARSTVQQVYDQIIKDLNLAISYMDGNPVTPADVLDSKPKRFVSLGAAYGLRARANLLMCKWADAASDAQAALDLSGAKPLSLEEASLPGFNDISAHNWIWGIAIAETDRVVTTGICNFPSHMGSFCYGYASGVGAWKWINKTLFAKIPSRDIRKGWWTNEDGVSANLPDQYNAFIEKSEKNPIRRAYIQVKFAPYQGKLNTQLNASDIPLMRAEEMYLIKAEALGMQNLADGIAALSDFVKTYRYQRYNFKATDLQAFRDEVWFQRRIELWGEGFSWFDLKRWNLPMERKAWVAGDPTSGNWSTQMLGENQKMAKKLPTDNAGWVMSIPNSELRFNSVLDISLLPKRNDESAD